MPWNEKFAIVAILCFHQCFLPYVAAFNVNDYKIAFNKMRGAPSVFPASSEITLLKDEDVWLNCSSPEPIIWQFEESFQNIKDVRKIDSYNDGEYRSAIHITKANEEHVGQYYCIKESARDFFDEYKFHLDDLEAQFNATSIYVFVSGLKNTVVPQTEKTITRDQVDGLDFVVQCKPTAKDVEVELVTYNEKKPVGRLVRKKGIYADFDSIDNDMEYLCRDKDRHNNFILLQTVYIGRPVKLYPLHITSKSEVRTEGIRETIIPVGRSVTLTCSTALCPGDKIDMSWYHDGLPITPSQRIQIGRMSYNSSSEDFCLDTISQTLTIERLTMDDAGSYKCMTSNRIRHEIEYGNFKLFVLDRKTRPGNRYTLDTPIPA